jgi:hypothetical protein
MSIERIYYCEGPGCHDHDPDDKDAPPPLHARTAAEPPHLPSGFIEARQRENGVDFTHHFCSWDCCMKFAAQRPVPEELS